MCSASRANRPKGNSVIVESAAGAQYSRNTTHVRKYKSGDATIKEATSVHFIDKPDMVDDSQVTGNREQTCSRLDAICRKFISTNESNST